MPTRIDVSSPLLIFTQSLSLLYVVFTGSRIATIRGINRVTPTVVMWAQVVCGAVVVWRGGSMVSARDSRSEGREFDPRPRHTA